MTERKSVSEVRGKQIMHALRGEDVSAAGPSQKKTKRTVLREPSSRVDNLSGVVQPEEARASSGRLGVMDATPTSSAPPATVIKSVSPVLIPTSADRGEGSSAEVRTVNFTLPSDFMAGYVLDGTSLFPHLEKYSLPSFRERFHGIPAGEIGSRVANLAFSTFQSSLALYAEVSKAEELAASALEREKAALEREKAALDRENKAWARADEFALRLYDAEHELEVFRRERGVEDSSDS